MANQQRFSARIIFLVVCVFFLASFAAYGQTNVATLPPQQQQVKTENSDWVPIEEGLVSWYGDKFHGQRTASGEIFNERAMTAAHRWLPFGTTIRVTNKRTNEAVIVRVNDRGPFIRGRVVDVSKSAAARLGLLRDGLSPARIDVPASMRAFLEERQRRSGESPQNAGVAASCPCAAVAAPVEARLASSAPDATLLPLGGPSLTEDPPEGIQPSVPSLDSAPKGSLFVQIGAYGKSQAAEKTGAAIDHIAPTRIDKVRTPEGRELYRLRLGPLLDAKEAGDVQSLLGSIGYPETRIVPF